ncbi:hypothetical protein DOY81_008629 [Sarcophaga bullata]|nr:hypothetical protein DOY81_008629 [Sarcophaga bullata]
MKDNLIELEGFWQFATAVDTRGVDEVQHCRDESIKGNFASLIVKTLHKNATYVITKHSRNWLKLKNNYLSGCGDSLKENALAPMVDFSWLVMTMKTRSIKVFAKLVQMLFFTK